MLQRRPYAFVQTNLPFSFFACDTAADYTFSFADQPETIPPTHLKIITLPEIPAAIGNSRYCLGHATAELVGVASTNAPPLQLTAPFSATLTLFGVRKGNVQPPFAAAVSTQVPPLVQASLNGCTAKLVGPVNVEFAGVVQSTWNLHRLSVLATDARLNR